MNCLDATESSHISRYINHSRKRFNIAPELIYTEQEDKYSPHIVFKTKKVIEKGEELLFDYGEKRPQIVKANPWLMD
jgi:histone-lysine N-methyltransferase SETD8